MSEHPRSLVLGQMAVDRELMELLQQNWQQFLTLFNQQLAEQAKTNEMLSSLIQALAEDEPEDPDAQPLTYMDGSPCR